MSDVEMSAFSPLDGTLLEELIVPMEKRNSHASMKLEVF